MKLRIIFKNSQYVAVVSNGTPNNCIASSFGWDINQCIQAIIYNLNKELARYCGLDESKFALSYKASDYFILKDTLVKEYANWATMHSKGSEFFETNIKLQISI